MKYFVTISAIASLTLLACSQGNLSPLEDLQANNGKEQYLVSAGDTIRVNVWGEPRVSGDVFVREDGNFTLPLINDVPAAGKSLQNISKDIQSKLWEFIPGASVSVSVVQSAAIRYYLSGAFAKPGEYRSDGAITLLQAIATGGGFAPFANDSSVMLIRRSPNGELRYKFDYSAVVSGDQPNPELRAGDTIAVK